MMIPAPIVRPRLVFKSSANTNDGTDGSSFTFSSMGVGSALDNRVVAVLCGWQSAGTGDILDTGTPPTIGGNTATIAANLADGNFDSLGCGIFYAALASGTTADVVITLTGSVARAAIIVLPLYGADTTLFDTPDTYDGVGGSPASLTQNVAAGGMALMVATNGDGSPSYSPSGETGTLADANMEGSNARYIGIYYETPQEVASKNLQIAYSAGQGPAAMASFAPT